MDRCTPAEEDRRGVVQGWTTRGNGQAGKQTDLLASSSRRTSIRTPRDQQNVPINEQKVLVAKHVTRRNRLRQRMRGMPETQG